jgi:hypothetical protein
MQINVGIVAASVPTLKPLLRRGVNTSNANQYNQYDDIEKSETIGSERRTRPCRSILGTLGTRTDDEIFELASRLAPLGHTQKNNIYTLGGERAGSEDLIVESDAKDSNRIRCTTEVVLENEKKGR